MQFLSNRRQSVRVPERNEQTTKSVKRFRRSCCKSDSTHKGIAFEFHFNERTVAMYLAFALTLSICWTFIAITNH